MKWNSDARERHQRMPIPVTYSSFALKQIEKIARKKRLTTVTVEEVQEAEELYKDYFGIQKTEEMKNLLEGKEPVPQIAEELFFDFSGMLYNIRVCPVKYGSQCKEVTDDIAYIFKAIKIIFESNTMEEIVADSSTIPLGPSSCFNVVLAGCSNCCEPPFLMDLGIIGQHIPTVTDTPCARCKRCLGVCYEGAIRMDDDGPSINPRQCINCEFCAKACPEGKIVIEKRGYKIVAGGRSFRHPVIAKTTHAFINKEEVVDTVNKLVQLLKAGKGDTMYHLTEKIQHASFETGGGGNALDKNEQVCNPRTI